MSRAIISTAGVANVVDTIALLMATDDKSHALETVASPQAVLSSETQASKVHHWLWSAKDAVRLVDSLPHEDLDLKRANCVVS